MEIEIRGAEPEEAAALVALAHRTILRCYRPFLGDAVVDGFVEGGFIERYLEENVGNCVVLVDESEIVGLAIALGKTIDLLLIDPDRQRRGLGSRLLGHVEAHLFHDWAELLLESFEANRPANDFFRRNGWTEAGRFVDEDSGLPKLRFRKVQSG